MPQDVFDLDAVLAKAPSAKAQVFDLDAVLAAKPPDPRGMMASGGVATRAGAQVIAPKNPQAVLGMIEDAGRVYQELPGAIAGVYGDYAQGALKGLGRMAAPLVKAVGLGNDYTDAALASENGVEGLGGGLAQTGASMLAGGPVVKLAKATGIPGMIGRALISPAGAGVTAAATTKAAGGSNSDAIQTGLLAAALGRGASGAKPIPTGKGAIKPLPAPKPTAAQIKAAVEAGPRGNAAKQAMRAEREAAKAIESAPKPVPTAPNPPAKPSSVPQTARDVDSALKSLDKASQARLKHVVKKAESKIETPKGDVVYAPPAFKGQQSGGTRARFEHQAKRQAKLREDAIKADAQKRANELGLKVRELKQSGKTPAEIREAIASETGFDADSVSQLVNIALKGAS